MADSLITEDTVDQNERDELFNKWKDKPAEEVLKAKVESDLYVKTLTTRMDDLRNDYLKLREEATAKAQLQDLIDQLKNPDANKDTSHETNREVVNQPSIKPEDIEKLVADKIALHETSNKQTENFNNIKAKLREQFGDNASSILKQRMDSLGLTQEFTDNLAKQHPSVFIKTFGLDEIKTQDTFNAPPRNSVRGSFAPSVPKRNWKYYQELKAKDPKIYLDPKIAVQMHNDAIELGESFYN